MIYCIYEQTVASVIELYLGTIYPMASLKLSAIELISSARLEPTEHHLLKHFVEGAVDQERAANYLLSSVDKSANQDVETCLRCFKKDWRDLVTTCGSNAIVLLPKLTLCSNDL